MDLKIEKLLQTDSAAKGRQLASLLKLERLVHSLHDRLDRLAHRPQDIASKIDIQIQVRTPLVPTQKKSALNTSNR